MKAKININPLGDDPGSSFMVEQARSKILVPHVIKTVRKVMGKHKGCLADVVKEVLHLAADDQEQALVLFMTGYTLREEIAKKEGLEFMKEAKRMHDEASKPKLITGQA